MDFDLFFQMLFLLAPAGLANMAPVWGSKIRGLRNFKTPVDLKLTYKRVRLLGDHKTYRGIILGVIIGGLCGLVQQLAIDYLGLFGQIDVALNNYSHLNDVNWIWLGFLIGLFALLGDTVKSFFKRRLGIAPGKPWPVLDQIDYLLGSFCIIGIFFNLSVAHYLIGLMIYGLMHPVVSYIGYLLKLKQDRF